MRYRPRRQRLRIGLKLLSLLGIGIAIMPFQKSFSGWMENADTYRVEESTLDLLDQVMEKSAETRNVEVR